MPRALKLILATALFGPVVMAQPAGPPPTTPPATEADISVRQRPTLSPQDMVAQSRDYRERINQILIKVQGMSTQAAKSKDIIRLNCLNDKLVQVKANLNIADEAIQHLQESIARKDEGATLHDYTRITIVHQKVQVLGAEADACVGEDLSFVGATQIEVQIEGVPDDDFTQPGGAQPDSSRPPVRAEVSSPML